MHSTRPVGIRNARPIQIAASRFRPFVTLCVLTLLSLTGAAQADEVLTWGKNLWGALGTGTAGWEGGIQIAASPVVPGPVNALGTVLPGQLAAGPGFATVLVNGTAYSWGWDSFDGLGNGAGGSSSSPVPVDSPMTGGVTALSTGAGQTLAIKGGQVYSWGRDDAGALGLGKSIYTYETAPSPQPVSGLTNASAISAGAHSSMAIQDGAIYAWGRNNGTGSASYVPLPVPVLTSGVTAISSGVQFNLAVKNGAAYIWGDYPYYSGNGTIGTSNTPEAITALNSGVTAVAAGMNFGVAIKDGNLYTWGDSADGRLGLGNLPWGTKKLTPVEVTTVAYSFLQPKFDADMGHFQKVVISYVAAFALAADGDLWVWGSDLASCGIMGQGYAGGGSIAPYLVPGYTFSDIAANPYCYTTGGADYNVVALGSPVPEPATLSLLALGGLALLKRRK